jgi:hypothetical protein
MIRLVAITMSEDEQRPIPDVRHADAERSAVNFTGEIERRGLGSRRTIDQREREQKTED